MTGIKGLKIASVMLAWGLFGCSADLGEPGTAANPAAESTDNLPSAPSSTAAGGTSFGAAGGGAANVLGQGSPNYAAGGASANGGSSGAGAFAPGAPAPVELNAGDQYEAVGTNPFVFTAHDPLSTFGADVDTASYDIFRRDVNLGILPQPESVRLEEYVNSFDYDYPAPKHDAAIPFSISLAAGPSFFARNSVTLRVGIQGKLAPPEQKKPANVVFLVDTSGSMMAADKLPLVKEVLSHSLQVLEPSDKVAIVTYAGSVRVALGPTLVAQSEAILAVLEGLEAGGSTAGASGIDLAYDQVELGFIEGGINHVVLCTDGDFNVGISDTDALVDLIEQKRQSGITLTALGFGIGNLNDAMMEQVSNAGNGIYSVITDVAHADAYAEESLLATMTHIAKDMKLQVEFNPEKVIAYRLLGYEDRAIVDEQFRDDTVDAGEVGSGHRVTALYELILEGEVPAVTGAPDALDGLAYEGALEVAADDLVLVKIRYKNVDASETDAALEVNASLAPADVAASVEALDADFQWAMSVASFAEILKDSPFAGVSMLPAIRKALANDAHDAYADRLEFRTLFTAAEAMMVPAP
jgi:Ca-activated chloride channel family protein